VKNKYVRTLSVLHPLKMEILSILRGLIIQNSVSEKVINQKIESNRYLNLITAIVIKEGLDPDHTKKAEGTQSHINIHHFTEVIQGQKDTITAAETLEIERDTVIDQMTDLIEDIMITTEVVVMVGIIEGGVEVKIE